MKSFHSIILASTISLLATPILAQQDNLPKFMQDIDGLSHQGQLSGIDIYKLEGFDFLFLVTPDANMAIAGTIFSSDGNDIGSAFLGKEPIRIFEKDSLSSNLNESQNNTSAITQSPLLDESPLLEGDELAKMEDSVDRMEQEILENGTSENKQVEEQSYGLINWPKAADESQPQPSNEKTTEEMTQKAESVLEGLEPEDREVLMTALIEMLQDVESREEFETIVDLWADEVVARHIASNGEASGNVVPQNNGEQLPEDALQNNRESSANNASQENKADQFIVENVQPALTPLLVQQDRPKTPEDIILEEMRNDAFWFGIGKYGAPVVYTFMDPACPYCARAILELGDAISKGELQLRVALVPVVSTDSAKMISAILNHETPPIAFMEHEYASAQGDTYLELQEWENIPALMRQGILNNVEMMHRNKVRGVPFFAFNTEDGAKIVNGVPRLVDFRAALGDEYDGSVE